MNIGILTSSFPSHPGDLAQAPFLIPFIRGLQSRGHRVFVFTQDRPGSKQGFLEGVHVTWFPWLKSPKALVRLNPFHPLDGLRIATLLYSGKRALVPFVRKHHIDACLALWILPSGYFARHGLQKAGVPYSVWALGSDIYKHGQNPLLRPIMGRIISEAKGVFADGFEMVKRIEGRFGRKCLFLATTRNVLPPPSLGKGNRMGSPNEAYRFLFVGRLEKVKGIDILLQSMELLIREESSARLTVVGRGSMEEWARLSVEKEGVRERVTFAGQVSDEELASLYASSDCVVIPSRSESIPLVFSEALRFNKALIVTDVGDMGTLGRDYGVATVVPPADPRALKEAMKGKIDRLGAIPRPAEETGRQALVRLFDIETSVERFLEGYRK
jgi:glycosyltransferase involved in cell wall biosynthesis